MSERISVTAADVNELLLALKSWREECRKGDFDYRLDGAERKLEQAKRKMEEKKHV